MTPSEKIYELDLDKSVLVRDPGRIARAVWAMAAVLIGSVIYAMGEREDAIQFRAETLAKAEAQASSIDSLAVSVKALTENQMEIKEAARARDSAISQLARTQQQLLEMHLDEKGRRE